MENLSVTMVTALSTRKLRIVYLHLHHQPQLVTPDLTAIDIIITTVWWFRNPANSPVEVGRFIIGYPIIYRVLYIPGGCLGCSSINRMLPTPLKDMFQPSLSANTVDVREFEATWTSDDACGWTWCNHIVIWYLNLKTYIIYNVLHTRYSY